MVAGSVGVVGGTRILEVEGCCGVPSTPDEGVFGGSGLLGSNLAGGAPLLPGRADCFAAIGERAILRREGSAAVVVAAPAAGVT